jgi:hypothetical protein
MKFENEIKNYERPAHSLGMLYKERAQKRERYKGVRKWLHRKLE